ncbi:hypothetical protein GQ600_13356 [Phytophthora cactorum]|nr:hypothetical protein GQ600_13356 [Phytophthora cactorum]
MKSGFYFKHDKKYSLLCAPFCYSWRYLDRRQQLRQPICRVCRIARSQCQRIRRRQLLAIRVGAFSLRRMLHLLTRWSYPAAKMI